MLAYCNALRQDPFLTHIGIKQCDRASLYIEKILPSIDIVLTSPLIRAIQTGLHMFPDHDINICPYICESNKSLENKPYSVNYQRKRLRNINKYEKVYYPDKNDGLNETDLTTFICYLCKHYSNAINDSSKNIAIVTHSNFLMDILKIKTRMNNNAIYEVKIDTNIKDVVSYKQVFSGYVFPDTINLKSLR